MALTKCSECGRTISDKAQACIGCGAPLASASESDHSDHSDKVFNLVPEPETRPPQSRQHLMWRAILSAAAFVVGVIWSSAVTRAGGPNGPAALIAGLLIVIGLAGVIVTALQFPWKRNQ